MNELKFNYGNDKQLDVPEREDLQAVWGQIEAGPNDPYAVRKYERYVAEQAFRPESMREYGEDRTEENLRMLEVTGNEQLAEIYKNVLEENPQLCVVKLVNEDIDGNAFFNWAARDTVTGQVLPIIRYNFSHPETYKLKVTDAWVPQREEGDKKLGIKFTMKQLALRMGASWRRCAQNKKLTSGMTFLHELGHANDFIENYLVPEYSAAEGMPPADRMARGVSMAALKVSNVRGHNLSMHLMPQESPTASQRAYREMSDEKYADEFALDYLLDHYDEFFVAEEKPAAQNVSVGTKVKDAIRSFRSGDERVRMEFGREIPMDADFAQIMGLTTGNKIKIEPIAVQEREPLPYDMKEGDFGIYGYENAKRYDADGNYIPRHAKPTNYIGRHQKLGGEGTVLTTLKEGGPVYLNDQDRAMRVCSNASGFRYVSSRDSESGKVSTQVFFNDESGLKYRVQRVSD